MIKHVPKSGCSRLALTRAQLSSAKVSSAQFSSRISAKQRHALLLGHDREGEKIIKIIIGYRVSCGTMTNDDECGQSLWLRLVQQDKPGLYRDAYDVDSLDKCAVTVYGCNTTCQACIAWGRKRSIV